MTMKIISKLYTYQNNRSFRKRITLSPELPEQIRNRVLAHKSELGKIARKNDCKLNFNPSDEQSVNMELLPAFRTYFDGYPMHTEYRVHTAQNIEINKNGSANFIESIKDFISNAITKLGTKKNEFIYSGKNQYRIEDVGLYAPDFFNAAGPRLF